MIKIQDKLWVVTHATRGPLAYMCQVTEKVDGTPDSATLKMMGTGRTWARSGPIGQQQGGTEAFHDNTPRSGFFIGDVSCRWSTDNKVFNVDDPRGFTVQVPSGNIPAILRSCTVVNGVIQEECIWGRDGGSHILLPVHSEEYIQAKKLITKVETGLIKPADLVIGDRVKLMNYGSEGQREYEFFGTVKLSWLRETSLNTYKSRDGYMSFWNSYSELVSSEPQDDEVIKDDKWVHVFGYPSSSYDYSIRDQKAREASRYEYTQLRMELTPKITERKAGTPTAPLDVAMITLSRARPPERVTKRFRCKDEAYESRKQHRYVCKDSVSAVEFKPQKKS